MSLLIDLTIFPPAYFILLSTAQASQHSPSTFVQTVLYSLPLTPFHPSNPSFSPRHSPAAHFWNFLSYTSVWSFQQVGKMRRENNQSVSLISFLVLGYRHNTQETFPAITALGTFSTDRIWGELLSRNILAIMLKLQFATQEIQLKDLACQSNTKLFCWLILFSGAWTPYGGAWQLLMSHAGTALSTCHSNLSHLNWGLEAQLPSRRNRQRTQEY